VFPAAVAEATEGQPESKVWRAMFNDTRATRMCSYERGEPTRLELAFRGFFDRGVDPRYGRGDHGMSRHTRRLAA
jgi:hypothetical protein